MQRNADIGLFAKPSIMKGGAFDGSKKTVQTGNYLPPVRMQRSIAFNPGGDDGALW